MPDRSDDNTWIVFVGDNGWLLGEHQFMSKVLAYEESIRAPMIIAGPKARTGLEKRFALNIDLAPTILDALLRCTLNLHASLARE